MTLEIPTSFNEVFSEIDVGTLERVASKWLCDTAINVMDQERKGKLTVTFEMEHIKNTQQLNIKATVKSMMPTMEKGERTESVVRGVAMYVGRNGKLSVIPESQLELEGISKKASEYLAQKA